MCVHAIKTIINIAYLEWYFGGFAHKMQIGHFFHCSGASELRVQSRFQLELFNRIICAANGVE